MIMQSSSTSSFRNRRKNLDSSQQTSPPSPSPSPTSLSSTAADIDIIIRQKLQHQNYCCCNGCQPKNCDATTTSLINKSGKPSNHNQQTFDDHQCLAIIIIIIILVITVAIIFVVVVVGNSSVLSTIPLVILTTSFITIIILMLWTVQRLSGANDDDDDDDAIMMQSELSIVLMDNLDDKNDDDDDDDEMKRSVSLLAATKRASNCFSQNSYSTTKNINKDLISYQNMKYLKHLEADHDHNESTSANSNRNSNSSRCSQPVIPVMMSQCSKNNFIIIIINNIQKIILLLILEFNKMNNDDHDHYDDHHEDHGGGEEQLEEAAAKNPIKPTRRRIRRKSQRPSPSPSTSSSSLDRLVKFVIIMMTILAAIDRFDVCDAKVKIHHINVPKFIENGTMDSVSLDCQYSLDPDEDHNLVVKWFFREDPEPIYQWIVEHDLRRVPQRYQGRVNPDYQVANQTEPWQRYRSLNLIRPTVEMTGRYSCHVISITSEAHDADTMIVYAKTKSINLVTRRVTRPRNITSNGSKTSDQTISFHNNRNLPIIQSDRQHQSDHPGHHQDGWPSSSSSSAAGLSSSRLFDGSGSRTTMQPPPQSSLRTKSTSQSNQQHQQQQESNNKPAAAAITVTEIECTVENVYPLPELTIYQVIGDGPNTQHPRSLERARVQQNSTQLPNGSFRVTMILSIDDEDLLNISNGGGGGGGSGNGGGPNSDHNHQHPQPKYHQNRLSSINQKSSSSSSHPPSHPPQPSSSSAATMMTKPTMFECLVAQDELKHELRKSTVFVPNIAQSWNESENHGLPNCKNQIWMFCWTIIIHLLIISLKMLI